MKIKDILSKIKVDEIEHRKLKETDVEKENCVFAIEDTYTYKKVLFFFTKRIRKRKLIIYYK